MDRQVRAKFKKLCIKDLLLKCCQIISDTHETLKERWRIITTPFPAWVEKSWYSVSLRTLKFAWKKVSPRLAQDRD